MIVYVHPRETSKKVNRTTGYQRQYDFDKENTGHIPYEPTYSYHIKPVRNPEREKPKWEDQSQIECCTGHMRRGRRKR